MSEKPRILFVDDEPSVTKNLSLLLRKQPWEIETAQSGQEGLAALAAKPFDVVVSDERMPEMSGSEFLTQVAEQSPQTVRIILSGQASLDATIRAINEAGIYRFLTKPCEKSDLINCLEGAIEAAKVAKKPAPETRVSPAASIALDTALDDLFLVFQPIALSRSKGLFGYEALIRSPHPDIPHPGILFDAAEEAGRVLEVERAIRRRIGAALPFLEPGSNLFVNLHPRTLDDPTFFAEDNPLFADPQKIVLEVTERASLDGIHDLEERMDFLRERGFRIAVDDLGAGYAGLNTFAKLKPDVVKLDIELIKDLDQSSTKRKVVESMIRLGRELDYMTVAEGIETKEELDVLLGMHCDLLQGFYLARPAKGFTLPIWPNKGSETPGD